MRWYIATIAWVLVLGGLTGASVASDQMFCVDRVDMLDRLASEYGEELIEVKEIEDQGLLELLVSRTVGTWTVLITRPGGISCVLATGKGLSTDENSLEQTEYML